MKKLIKVLLSLMCICFLLIDFGTSVIVVQARESIQKTETIVTRADIIEWRYKIVDGVIYRRQYNASNGQWIGSWEPC